MNFKWSLYYFMNYLFSQNCWTDSCCFVQLLKRVDDLNSGQIFWRPDELMRDFIWVNVETSILKVFLQWYFIFSPRLIDFLYSIWRWMLNKGEVSRHFFFRNECISELSTVRAETWIMKLILSLSALYQ